MALTPEEIRMVAEVVKELGVGYKNDPASTTLTAPTLQGQFHGNEAQYGLFSDPGVRPDRFSALVRPRSLASAIGVTRSEFIDEILEIMTGVTAAAGTNATGWCGNPPTVGVGKVCQQIYRFGKFLIKTDLNALPEIGSLRNRADVPGNILNAAPAQRNPFIPDLMYRLDDTRSQLRYELWRLGVHLERTIDSILITGDYSLTSVNTEVGWIKEFNGLDLQIKTGYADADSGLVCPAADSAVLSFNAAVDGTIGGGDGRNLVQAVHDLVWAVKDRAREMGMEDTEFAFIGRKELFRSIVEVWACNYATYRCNTGTAGNPYVNDVVTTNQLRLEMMNGQYLLIDGVPVPYIFSEGVVQESLGSNIFKSDLYFAPISWAGMPLLHVQHFPLDNAYIQEFASLVDPNTITTMNNGMFMAGYRSTGLCLEYHFAAKFRMILETPFLAGRVDDIRYTFRAPIRNSNPADTWFHADGGTSYRT